MKDMQHYFWKTDTVIYSFYMFEFSNSDKKIHYIQSMYDKKNIWNCMSDRYIGDFVKTFHQVFCVDINKNYYDNFKWTICPTKQIRNELVTTIQDLCNYYKVISPSRDVGKLWYPDDLLKFIKTSNLEQYERFLDYITKENRR